jgi:dTDP-4-amino-4,6-dideoxygalactose transaminase
MVLLSGFEPIFIDHYKNSPEIDLKCLKKNIDNYGNRIGAVLLTHYNVNNSKLDDIVKICKKNNIMLIEDCAISIGSKFKNDYVGKFGDFSIFSFGFYKFINVLSGGMIFSKNKSFYNYVINEEKTWKYAGFHNLYKSIFKNIFIRIFTSKIIFNIIFPVIRFSYENNIKLVTKYLINDPKPHKKNDFPENYKYRLSELQKNDIVFQLDRIEYQRKIRKQNYFRYLENIKNKKIKFFHNENSLLNENAYLNFPIIIQTKEHFMNYMLSNGIDLSPQFYRSVNTLAFFKDYADKTNLIQETVTNLVFLPTYDKIENKYIDMTIDIINEY